MPIAQPAASAPTAPAAQTPVLKPLPVIPADLVNPNCSIAGDGHVACDLLASGMPIGVGVPAGTYVTFTNRGAGYLQIDDVAAFTNERATWSEFCAYAGELVTGQHTPGRGEVGCSTKNIGEDYAPIKWGAGTGLSVAPGGVIFLNSHTEPVYTGHTYAMTVKPQTRGVYAWRQPQHDAVITCNAADQVTAPSPLRNDSASSLYVSGASIYSEAGDPAAPNTMKVAACIYVMAADGSTKYTNCDAALRQRGEVSFPPVEVAPGEYVSAQASNRCAPGGVWDWAAFLQVTGGTS